MGRKRILYKIDTGNMLSMLSRSAHSRSTQHEPRIPMNTTHPLMHRPFLLTSTLAAALMALLAAGASPALAQVSVDRPDEVQHLRDASETVVEANETASQMAEEMKASKEKFDRHLKKLSNLEKGTQEYTLTYERARSAHSEMMRVRKDMLDKLQAAYGSAIGSVDKALKSRDEEGAKLAEQFEEKAEKAREGIEEVRTEGEKVEVIRDHGEGDKQYREVLNEELRTLRHQIGIKKDYAKKTEANAEKVRESGQAAFYDQLREIRATLQRHQSEFKLEEKHLKNTAQRLRQEVERRDQIATLRDFYDKMQKMTETMEGLDEEVKSIYGSFPEGPSIDQTLPDAQSLGDKAGSPVMDEATGAPEGSFKEGGDEQ